MTSDANVDRMVISASESPSDELPTAITPSALQVAKDKTTIAFEGREYTTVQEGLAKILLPPEARTFTDPKGNQEGEVQQVFYNPIQQFNRDLSVLAIRAFGEDLLARRAEKYSRRKRARPSKGQREEKKRAAAGASNDPEGGVQLPTDGEERAAKRQRTTEDVDGAVKEGAPGAAAEPVLNGSPAEPVAAPEPSRDQPEQHTPIGSTTEQPTTTPKPTHTGPKFRILDALSATGLRALRYALEIPFVTSVTANDLSRPATEAIAANVRYNNLTDKIKPNAGNAVGHMYSFVGHEGSDSTSPPRYDVIDLDPYGTAAPFIDAAVQAVVDGGLLCVTCTDSGVWASTGYLEKCYSLYGGLPVKGLHSHEAGLRIVLHSIASSAARYGISIEPLLSLSIDYYVRVFVRVKRSPADVKFTAGKMMLVYSCDGGCGAWSLQPMARNVEAITKFGNPYYKHSFAQAPSVLPHCEHCGMKTHLSGPMWAGPLHNPVFIEKILNYLPEVDREVYPTSNRIEGMLTTAMGELLCLREDPKPTAQKPNGVGPNGTSEDTAVGTASDQASAQAATQQSKASGKDPLIPPLPIGTLDTHPFYVFVSHLAKVLHCQAPPEPAFRGALMHLGYRVTRTHAKSGGNKTDAPWSVIWEVMREWVRTRARIRQGAVREGTAGFTILGGAKELHKYEVEGYTEESERNGEETVAAAETTNGTEAASKRKIVFDEELGKYKEKRKLMRYQMNPRANWGPMTKAKGVPPPGKKPDETLAPEAP